MLYHAISFLCGVVFTIVAEFVAVYFYGRRAANRKSSEK